MKRQWTITTEISGKERHIELVLHDDVKQMRAAARRFSKKLDEETERGFFGKTLAVAHAYRTYDADIGIEADMPEVATIRFVRGHLLPEVTSHEVLHIAQWLYLADVLGEDSTDLAVNHFHAANERFAHMFGGLYAVIMEILKDEL